MSVTDAPPLVSVVVVTWNKSGLTAQCVEETAQSLAGTPHEIVVVDNGSAPADVAALRVACGRHGCRLIELNRNLFFGEANNIGVEAARGEYVLLLNNDAMLPPDCFPRLLHALRTAFRAGAVGPRFLYPDGRLQEAGAYMQPDGRSIQHGKVEPAVAAIAGPGLHIVDYCSAACLLLRRDTFLAHAGFDPRFDPAYYEDVDLCMRLRANGQYVYYCGDATAIHDENVTSREVWKLSELQAIVQRNRKAFLGRWGEYLSARIYGHATLPRYPAIGWQAEPQRPASGVLVVRGPGLVDAGPAWKKLLAAAVAAGPAFVQIEADEACSRCRVYALAAAHAVDLPPFAVRRRGATPAVPGETLVELGAWPGNVVGEGPLFAAFAAAMA